MRSSTYSAPPSAESVAVPRSSGSGKVAGSTAVDTPVERAGATVYELRMDPSDVGKIIGRQGMTINAIRSLLLAGSAKKGLRCSVEIVEDKPAK